MRGRKHSKRDPAGHLLHKLISISQSAMSMTGISAGPIFASDMFLH